MATRGVDVSGGAGAFATLTPNPSHIGWKRGTKSGAAGWERRKRGGRAADGVAILADKSASGLFDGIEAVAELSVCRRSGASAAGAGVRQRFFAGQGATRAGLAALRRRIGRV